MTNRSKHSPYEDYPQGLGEMLSNPQINTSEHELYWPILEAMLPDTATSILDFGCGPGNFTELLAQKYPAAHVIGVDAVADILPQTSDRVEYKTWSGDTPFPTADRFDLVVAKMVLHYLSDAQLRRLTHHIIDALDTNGIIAYSVPHPVDSSYFNIAKSDEWHRRNATGSIKRMIGSTGIEAAMYHRNTADWINIFWSTLKERGLKYTPAIDDAIYDKSGNPKRLNVMLVPYSRLDEIDKAYARLDLFNPVNQVAVEVPYDSELMTGNLDGYPFKEVS